MNKEDIMDAVNEWNLNGRISMTINTIDGKSIVVKTMLEAYFSNESYIFKHMVDSYEEGTFYQRVTIPIDNIVSIVVRDHKEWL